MYVRIKGFKIFKDRHGKLRCYHRKTNTKIDLVKSPLGSTEFFAECQRISSRFQTKPMAVEGTLGGLIKCYIDKSHFHELASRTQKDYYKLFDYLHAIEDTSLDRFDPPTIAKIRDKAVEKLGLKWGNETLSLLSRLFKFAIEYGQMKTNPAENINPVRKPKNRPQANRPWKDSERDAVLSALPPHMILPITIMMYCGIDPTDTLSLKRNEIVDGCINSNRAKTGEPIWLQLPETVIQVLKDAPQHNAITICANSFGSPWTKSGFDSAWKRLKAKLLADGKIKEGLTLKGLRHTVATLMAELGYDDRTIADYLSQKTTTSTLIYTKQANRANKLVSVIENVNSEMNKRRTAIVKPN